MPKWLTSRLLLIESSIIPRNEDLASVIMNHLLKNGYKKHHSVSEIIFSLFFFGWFQPMTSVITSPDRKKISNERLKVYR